MSRWIRNNEIDCHLFTVIALSFFQNVEISSCWCLDVSLEVINLVANKVLFPSSWKRSVFYSSCASRLFERESSPHSRKWSAVWLSSSAAGRECCRRNAVSKAEYSIPSRRSRRVWKWNTTVRHHWHRAWKILPIESKCTLTNAYFPLRE